MFRQSIQTQPFWSASHAAPLRAARSSSEAEHEKVICHFSSVLQPWLQAPPRNQASSAQMFSLSWLLGIWPFSNYLQSLENQGLMCSQKLAHCPEGYLSNIAVPREHHNKYLCPSFLENFFILHFLIPVCPFPFGREVNSVHVCRFLPAREPFESEWTGTAQALKYTASFFCSPSKLRTCI